MKAKMLVFQERYSTIQVWGAATPARVAYLKRVAKEIDVPAQVVLAEWFRKVP